MAKKRATIKKRLHQPLAPVARILVVNKGGFTELAPEQVNITAIGRKGFGLSCIPTVWTKPFFVVTADSDLSESALMAAMSRLNINSSDNLLVRSSGVDESIEQRGALISERCLGSRIKEHIERLKQQIHDLQDGNASPVHWVVQPLIATKAKGHLSNERRLNKDLRDWVAEVEASPGSPSEAHRIAIRTWRDDTHRSEQVLVCDYRANLTDQLETVARWTYDRKLRVHYEWVWDGAQLFIVQADNCEDEQKGVDPKTLVHGTSHDAGAIELKLFRVASAEDYKNFRKLENAAIYKKQGYDVGGFFVLDDPVAIAQLLESGECGDHLKADLSVLTKRPLVIRTDGKSIPDEKKQMLPRSDELRSQEAALSYLVSTFTEKIIAAGLEKTGLCLIAHHFIPATSSAWCKAHPDQRRVRIESLWGIPEGLYWYAYDVFDVDTHVSKLAPDQRQPDELKIRERLRYKERFVAPDEHGAWIVQQTAAGPDWGRSIQREEWIKEIAWTSRRIASAVGKSVIVMWFIDIPQSISSHRVIPWYHEPSHRESPPSKAAPRKKSSSQIEYVIQNTADWELLQKALSEGAAISRVRVEPTEPELVRSQKFAGALAESAKKYNFVVELSGGILSHAYYMLTRQGCEVECVDLDDYATEEDEAEFNKLVRDKIPELIQSRGENVELVRLEGEALIEALRCKLIEESFEVFDARTTTQITEELADLLEVANALATRLGITNEAIDATRKKKGEGRGVFDRALMLTRTALVPPLFHSNLPEAIGEEGISSELSKHQKTISDITKLPKVLEGIHVDKRRDSTGTFERQFSFLMPIATGQFNPPRVAFSLPTPGGGDHAMNFEITFLRDGTDFRSRIRLINAPAQLAFDFPDDATQ